MTFSPEQKAALEAPLSKSNVKRNPRGFDYVESWHAEAEANRIFGYDGWSSVVLNFNCVVERERKLGSSNNQYDGWGVSYIATVRVTAGGEVRDGVGAGHGMDKDLGLAHESALKEAASDAEKRALKTFGNQFGLALYDKTRENVTNAPPEGQRAPLAAAIPSRATKDQPWESRALDPADEFDGLPEGTRGKTTHFARQAGDDKLFKDITAEIGRLESATAVGAFIAGRKDAIAKMPAEWRATLKADLEQQRQLIRQLAQGSEATEDVREPDVYA